MQASVITLDEEDFTSLIEEGDVSMQEKTSSDEILAARVTFRTSTKVENQPQVNGIAEPSPIETSFPTLVPVQSRYLHTPSRTLKK